VQSLPFDVALLAAFQGLPEGARQLVHRLNVEDVELEVEAHLAQVGRWAVELAAAAGVALERRRLLAQAAFVHDAGKLALSRSLLQKPGPLSAEERALVAQHVGKGVALLRALEVDDAVIDIVAAHHERWDGTGYPNGLAGEAIPLEARILAIADSFDAMTSERVYHAARTRDDAAAELRRQAGRQFEAALVELFLGLPQNAR
jgi:putative nucleotidyltransferase with HDIG domain